MPEQAGLTINKEQQVTYSRSECSYLISKRDWTRLSKTVQRLKPAKHFWSNAAWGFLGIGVSCLVSWLPTQDYQVLLVVGCISLGFAVAAFIAKRSENKQYMESVEGLKDVMSDIEEAMIDNNTGLNKDDE